MFDENSEDYDDEDYKNIALSSVRYTYHTFEQTGQNMQSLGLTRAMMGCDFTVDDPSSLSPATARIIIETFMRNYMQLRLMVNYATTEFNRENETAFEAPNFKYEIKILTRTVASSDNSNNEYDIEFAVVIGSDPFLEAFDEDKYNELLGICQEVFAAEQKHLEESELPSASIQSKSENFVFGNLRADNEDTES